MPIVAKVAGSAVRRESSTDCVFCEHDFFVFQRPKFGNNPYVYREAVPKVTRSTAISALRIGEENTPSIRRKYEDEQIAVAKAKGYFSVGILVIRVNVLHGNRETFLV